VTSKDIKRIRKKAGLTQKALAEELGTTVTTVARWEMGIVKPNEQNARQIRELAKKRGAA
jgi:DNA-binding transcriptional regulator YiaG